MSRHITPARLRRMAAAFRSEYHIADLRMADVWDMVISLPGDAGVLFGMYLATPWRHRRRVRKHANALASALEAIATDMEATP